jgi:hypothetical protein
MGGQTGLMGFARAIAQSDRTRVSRLIAARPELATERFEVGATRDDAEPYFLDEIDHYVYAADTALHIAAAAHAGNGSGSMVGNSRA